MEMQTKLEIPAPTAMNCKIHNRMIQCLNISESTPTFLCVRCLLSNSQKSLEIQEIQECSESHVFNGWPFKDDEFSKTLARILNNESANKDQLDQQLRDQQTFINSSILQIQKDIIVAIEKEKEAFIYSSNVINQEKAAIMRTYNQITRKAKLKELLDGSSDQLLANEPKLRSLFSEAIQDADKNQETLQNQIEELDRKLEELSIPWMKNVLKIAVQKYVDKSEFLHDDNHEQDRNDKNNHEKLLNESNEKLKKQLKSAEIELKKKRTQIEKQDDLIIQQSKKINEQEENIKQTSINEAKLREVMEQMKQQIFQKESTIIEFNLAKKKMNSDLFNQEQSIVKNVDSDELQQLKSDYTEKINKLMMSESQLSNQLLDSQSQIKQLQMICSKQEKKITESYKPKGCGKQSSYNLLCSNPSCNGINKIYRVLDSIGNKGGKHCGDECFECRENDRKGVFRCASDQNKKKVICPYNNKQVESSLVFLGINDNETQTQKSDQQQQQSNEINNKSLFSLFKWKK